MPLNTFVALSKFRMEMVVLVLASIGVETFMFSTDLKDECFQTPMHPELTPYLQFIVNKKIHPFEALCFSLSTAPQVFTSVFALFLKEVHQIVIQLHQYLDD